MGFRERSFGFKLFVTAALFSFIAGCAFGAVYFTDEPAYFKVVMTVKNSFRLFAFEPDVPLDEAVALARGGRGTAVSSICCLYAAASLTAPCCTVAAVFKVLEQALAAVFSFRKRRGGRQLLIIGCNEDVKTVISNAEGTRLDIHIIAESTLPEEDRFELRKLGCAVHCADIYEAEPGAVQKRLRAAGAENAEAVLLFDKDPVSCLSVLELFCTDESKGGVRLREGTRVICRCDDDNIAGLISEQFGSAYSSYKYDLECVSINELRVRRMFEEKPLYSVYTATDRPVSEWSTHLLIAGFGGLGRQAALQAISLGVFDSENPIRIDIFDEDIDSKLELFMNGLSGETFIREGRRIRLSPKVCDGELLICGHSEAAGLGSFIGRVRSINEEMPFTYAVIDIPDAPSAVGCAEQLCLLFAERGQRNVPVCVKADRDRRLAQLIAGNEKLLAQALPFAEISEVLTLRMILSRELHKSAKQLNYIYSTIQVLAADEQGRDTGSSTPEELWNSLPLFKRSSSRALAAHIETKKLVYAHRARELGSDTASLVNEALGENGSVMRRSGSIWRLRGTDADLIEDLKHNSFLFSAAASEHRRWCCFMATQGWRYSPVRRDEYKMHTCLLPFEELCADPAGSKTVKYDLMPLMKLQ